MPVQTIAPRARPKPVREKVDFDKPPVFTFGWELEASTSALRRYSDIEAGHDGSVSGDAMEYKVAAKAVKDPVRSLLALRRLLSDPEIGVDESCGFHVHVGLPFRTRHAELWAQCFVALAREVEARAFEAVPDSRRENSYCRAWATQLSGIKEFTYHPQKYDNAPARYQWVNVVEMFRRGGIKTVEVRLMGDSQSYCYLLAWTAFCRLMAQAAWRSMGDISSIQKEAEELKKVLREIRDSFLLGLNSSQIRAYHALSLARKVGLAESNKRPLEVLARAEKMDKTFRLGDKVRLIKRPHDDYSRGPIDGTYEVLENDSNRPFTSFRGGWYVFSDCLELVRSF